MAGGTWSTSVSSQNGSAYKYTLTLSWNTGSQSIENNTTYLYATASLDGQWIGWSGTNVTATLYWWDNRKGDAIVLGQTTWTSGGYGQGGARSFAADRNILHNNDGTLSGHAWVSLSSASNGYAPSSVSYGGNDVNQSFTTIPRSSKFTLSSESVELGKDLSVTISPNSSSYKHILYYQMDSEKTKIADIAAGVTSYTWTTPTDLISSITTSSSKQITLILETYKDSSSLGSKSNALTITVPESYVPTINSITITDTNQNISSKFGFFVQSKSQPKFTVSASGNSGSTIVSTLIAFENKTYLNIDTTDIINGSGNISYSVTVADSRGRQATQTNTLTVIPYNAPTVTNLSAKRANSSYEIDESEGEYALLGFTYSISQLNNKNTASFTIQYRKVGDAWKTINTWSEYSKTSYVFKGAGNIFNDKTANYEVRFGIKDYFYNDYLWVSTIVVSYTYTLINFGSSGKSVSLFGQSNDEENTMEINGTAKLLIDKTLYSLNSIASRFFNLESWKQTIESWKTKVENGETDVSLNGYCDYSTDEINTHTTWIDGKTIYKKTINTGSIANETKNVSHGITDYETIIKCEGIAYKGLNSITLPRGHRDNEHDGISIGVYAHTIWIDAGSSNTFSGSYVTVYYTKTS